MGQSQPTSLHNQVLSVEEVAKENPQSMDLAVKAITKQAKIVYEMSQSKTFSQIQPQLNALTTEVVDDIVKVADQFRAENAVVVSEFVKSNSAQISEILQGIFHGKLTQEQIQQLLDALNSSIQTFRQLTFGFVSAILLPVGGEPLIPVINGLGLIVEQLFKFLKAQNPAIANALYKAIYGLIPQIANQVKTKFVELKNTYLNRGGAYEQLYDHYKLGKYEGGADGDILANYAQYRESSSAKSKELLFKDILATLSDLLGSKVEGETDDDKIKNLMKKLPSEETLQKNPSAHVAILKKIAAAINKQFGNKIIDSEGDPKIIITQVAEILKSLTTGMNSEFLYVIGEVRSVLKHLLVGKQLLNDIYKSLENKIKVSTDEKNKVEIQDILAGHDELLQFFDYYITILQNLLNINISKSEGEISDLMLKLDYKDSNIAASDLKNYISKLLSGMAITSLLAKRVNDALKDIGISLEEYMKTKNLKYIQEKITQKLANSDLSDKDIEKYFKAAELLVKNYWRSDKIAAYIKEEKIGSAEETTTIDKRVKLRGEIKKIIITTFETGLNESYSAIIQAIAPIGRKIGDEIPITEQLETFRSYLARYAREAILNEHIAWALVGAYKDAESKMKKENIQRDIRLIVQSLDVIIAMKTYEKTVEYFKDVRIQFKNLETMIDKFADMYVKKFGSQKYVGAEDEIDGGAELSSTFKKSTIKTGKKFIDFFLEFDHFYKTAQIKKNLKMMSGEVEVYGEKYETLLGKSVASKIQEIKKTNDDAKTAIAAATVVATAVGRYAKGKTIGIDGAAELNKLKDKAKAILDDQLNARKDFWRALQAIDIYLKSFTDGMIKNPEDVMDLKNMLDETEIINEWYNEEAGNNLAKMFEYYPSAELAKYSSINGTDNTASIENYPADHYYTHLKTNHPGIPINPTSPMWIDKINKCGEDLFKNFIILKNLLSLFVHIGDKFGKKEVHNETFMTVSQIYDALVNYMIKTSYMRSMVPLTLTVDPDGTISDAGGAVADTANDVTITKLGIGTTIAADSGIDKTFFAATHIKDKDLNTDPGRLSLSLEFELERDLFVNAIKAIAGKVLTVVGACEMFSRPIPSLSYNPIRFIIGGAEIPQVNVDLVELYFRIPLLIQFYIELFDFEGNSKNKYEEKNSLKGNKSAKITLIPDFNTIYGDLINLLFKIKPNEAESNKFYNYTNDEIANIVGEINLIYNRFTPKNKENVINEIIDELVLEVNRRYGIVLEDEKKAILAERNENRNLGYGTSTHKANDYPILPGEDESNYEVRKLAPSDSYLQADKQTDEIFDSKFDIKGTHIKLVENFRCILENALHVRETEKEYQGKSFKPMLELTTRKLKELTDDKEKFEVICKLIRGNGIYNKFDDIKYLMFHETVVAGLNILSGIHSNIARFKAVLNSININKLISKFIETIRAINATNTNVAWTDVMNDFYDRFTSTDYDQNIIKIICAPNDSFNADLTTANTVSFGIDYAANPISFGARTDVKIFTDAAPTTLGIDPITTGVGAGPALTTHITELNNPEGVTRRLLFNRHAMFEIFVEELYRFSSDINGLTNINFNYDVSNKTKISIDFTGLKQCVVDTFSNISSMLEYFRPHIKEEMYIKYTNKGINGSYYNLYEKLMDNLFQPQDSTKKSVDKDLAETCNIIWADLTLPEGSIDAAAKPYNHYGMPMSQKVFYNALDKYTGIIKDKNSSVTAAAGGPGPTTEMNPHFLDFTGLTTPLESLSINDMAASVSNKLLGLKYSVRFTELYTFDNSLTLNRSLMFNFNQLLAKYINSCFDSGLLKIYVNCISDFANGVLNNAVIDYKNTIPDMPELTATTGGTLVGVTGAALNTYIKNKSNDKTLTTNEGINGTTNDVSSKFGHRFDPKAGSILLTSLSLILKNLISIKGKSGTPLYLIENINDVPLYLKEKLRTNLPIFKTLFTDLINRANFLRKIIDRSDLDLERPAVIETLTHTTTDVNLTNVLNNLYDVGIKPKKDKESTKTLLLSICNSVINASSSIVKCCETVLREIPDDSKYFELNKDFIKDYKLHNKVDPLMPLSDLVALLNINPIDNETLIYPKYMPFNIGEADDAKFAYGTRTILGALDSEVKEDTIPGVYTLLNTFNFAVGNNNKLEKNRLTDFTKNFIKLSRTIYEQTYIKQLLKTPSRIEVDTVNNLDMSTDPLKKALLTTIVERPTTYTMILAANTDTAANGFILYPTLSYVKDINGLYTTSAYQIGRKMPDIIQLTEGYNVEKNISIISNYLYGEQSSALSIIALNIMDMNIMPINIHALMRSVPFINLYNYSNTFDRAIIDLLWGYNTSNSNAIYKKLCDGDKFNKPDGSQSSSRYTFMRYLKNPYIEINKGFNEKYLNTGDDGDMFIQRLMIGDSNLEFGRPKFLSDQLFNKALFGQMYYKDDIRNSYDENGPSMIKNNYYYYDTYRNGLNNINNAEKFTDTLDRVDNLFANRIRNRLSPEDQRLLLAPGPSLANITDVRIFNGVQTAATYAAEYLFNLTGVQVKAAIDDLLKYVKKIKDYVNDPTILNGNLNDVIDTIRNTLKRMLLITAFNVPDGNRSGTHMNIGTSDVFDKLSAPYHVGTTLIENYLDWILNVIFNILYVKHLKKSVDTNKKLVIDGTLANIKFRLDKMLPDTINVDFRNDYVKYVKNEIYTKLFTFFPTFVDGTHAKVNLINADGITAATYDIILDGTADAVTTKAALLLYFNNAAVAVGTSIFREVNNSTKIITLTDQEHADLVKTQTHKYPTENYKRLTYIKAVNDSMRENDEGQVVEVDLSANPTLKPNELYVAGKIRFDTVLVRNLTFITNVYRSLRLKLQKDLMYNKSIINSSLPIIKDSTTEYKTNEVFKKSPDYDLQTGFAKRFQ